MRTMTSIVLPILLLSCSSTSVVKRETVQSTSPSATIVTMLDDTTIVYDRTAYQEVTLDDTSNNLPKLVSKVNPKYPEIALRAGIQGNVYVQALISPSGHVRTAKILTTDAAIFNQSALEAAMQWKFEPPTLNGKPIAAWVKIPFRFRVSNKY